MRNASHNWNRGLWSDSELRRQNHIRRLRNSHLLEQPQLFNFDLVACLEHLDLLLPQRDLGSLNVELRGGADQRSRLRENNLRSGGDEQRILKLRTILCLQLGQVLLRHRGT